MRRSSGSRPDGSSRPYRKPAAARAGATAAGTTRRAARRNSGSRPDSPPRRLTGHGRPAPRAGLGPGGFKLPSPETRRAGVETRIIDSDAAGSNAAPSALNAQAGSGPGDRVPPQQSGLAVCFAIRSNHSSRSSHSPPEMSKSRHHGGTHRPIVSHTSSSRMNWAYGSNELDV